jgi:hypothetical protein
MFLVKAVMSSIPFVLAHFFNLTTKLFFMHNNLLHGPNFISELKCLWM